MGPHMVHMSQLLVLHPPDAEAAFWESPAAVRLLKTFNMIALCYSLLLHTAILFARSGQLPALYRGIFHLSRATSLVQLVALLLWPHVHHRWRFHVAACNRLLRLVTHTAACIGRAHAVASSILPVGRLQRWLQLLRPLLSPPVMLLNDANFVLPFKYVLPAQAWTFAVSLFMMQAYVCAIALTRPQLLPLSELACMRMKDAMHTVGMAFGGPPVVAAPGVSADCQGVSGLVLLGLYAYVLLVLLVPCLVVYLVELNLKVRFVAGQGARLHLRDTWAIMDSRLIQTVCVAACVVGGWFVCEMVVVALAPSRCASDATLVLQWSRST